MAGLGLIVDVAQAADMPMLRPAPPVQWNWTGLYWGAHVGGSLSQASFSDPAGPGIYGGSVRNPAALAGIQLGYNYQPAANWVLGAEADLSALNGYGTNTCLASAGNLVSANCRIRQGAFASLTGRVGLVTGPGGRTLLYAKGGGAYLRQKIDIASNFDPEWFALDPAPFATAVTDSRFGWTVGAGIEQALAPAWSVKVEYDYANFGTRTMATPQSLALDTNTMSYLVTPQSLTKVTQDLHTVKVGLNLKFGGDTDARFDDYALRGSDNGGAPAIADAEIGARVWYSFGNFQKDLGRSYNEGVQNILISRLTYQAPAVSGEVFGRIDGPADLFLKGFAGGGTLLSGKMHDEDWIPENAIPYSNTLSDPVKGSIAYATLDAGYDMLRGSSYKFGGFVGYNYYRDNKSAYGCVQIADQSSGICAPSIANTVLGITENDSWHSLRIGLNGELGLGHGFTLTADAAYLPYVKFYSADVHLLRGVPDPVSPERGAGQGVQLEGIIAYRFNNAFSLGAGARYWAMWATTNAYTNIFGSDCPCQTLPARVERYGTFLQASYKFDNLR